MAVGIGNPAPGAADMPQYAVDKPCHVTFTESPCLLDRFIDGRRLRDPIHEKNLIKGDEEDIQNGRVDFSEREAEILPDDPVKPESPSKNPLNQMYGKGPIPFTEMRFFLEGPPQVLLRKTGAKIKTVERG